MMQINCQFLDSRGSELIQRIKCQRAIQQGNNRFGKKIGQRF
jgi:hypothetical protein